MNEQPGDAATVLNLITCLRDAEYVNIIVPGES